MNLLNKIAIYCSVVALTLSANIVMASSLDLPIKTINGRNYYYYQVQPKETLYSLCKHLGVTKKQLIEHNPAVADGLKNNQMLYFPVDAFSNDKEMANANIATINHKAKKGETVYGICKSYGITEDQFFSFNPQARNGIKSGMILTIPTDDVDTNIISDDTEEVDIVKVEMGNTNSEVKLEEPLDTDIAEDYSIDSDLSIERDSTLTAVDEDPTETKVRESINIAVMLPFMLEQDEPDKQAQLYTEFYKGILIATDSLRNIGTPINISAYDTANSLSEVSSILTNDTNLPQAHVIIGPNNEDQLNLISNFAHDNNITLFNIFDVKSNLHNDNKHVMQANIPHSEMYRRAINYIIQQYVSIGYTPVILSSVDGKNDKQAFVNEMIQQFNNDSITYQQISYTEHLKDTDVAILNKTKRYIFIPSSGALSEFNRMMSTLKQLKDSMEDTEAIVTFGYPEWTTFRGESLDNLHILNSVVYSRFYNDENSSASLNFEEKFKQWYGTPMMRAIPQQGILGFDAGMYLIKTMHDNINNPESTFTTAHDGIQSGFRFITLPNIQGAINDTLYIINFRPSGIIERSSI